MKKWLHAPYSETLTPAEIQHNYELIPIKR